MIAVAVRLSSLFVVWAVLLGWALTADRLSCPLATLVLAAAAGLIARYGVEAALVRRRAFVGQYLVAGGRLYRLLTGRALVLSRQGAKGLVLGLLLLVGALGLEPVQWVLLLVDVALFAFLVAVLGQLLERQVRREYLGPLARSWATRLNAVLLWIAWLTLMFSTPQANYAGLRWEEVLALAAAQPAVACEAVAIPARLAAVSSALTLWSAQHLFAGLHEATHVLLAWGVFLAAFGASFLLALAYSSALAGVLARGVLAGRVGSGGAA